MEGMTARGIRVNTTVSCTVPQAAVVAHAFERGLKRTHDEGDMKPANFIGYGATQHMLTQFLGACADLAAQVRARMPP